MCKKTKKEKHKLAEEFYILLHEAGGCPITTRGKIEERNYEKEDLGYMIRLLNRWVEWEVTRGAGGRKMYAYLKLMNKI